MRQRLLLVLDGVARPHQLVRQSRCCGFPHLWCRLDTSRSPPEPLEGPIMKPVRTDFGAFPPMGTPSAPRSSDAESSMGSISGDGQLADAASVSSQVRSTIRVLVIDDDRT